MCKKKQKIEQSKKYLLNKLAEPINSFDERWEKEFGSDEGTDVLSVEDFFAEFTRMKKFK